MKYLLTIIATLLLMFAPLAPAAAQNDVAAVPFSKAPYRVGERLTYNVSFANFFTAAHIELWIAGHNTYFNRDGIQLRAHVETTGVVNAALYSINNDYITYIAPETGLPFHTQQLRRQAGSNEQDISREYNEPVGADAIPGKVRTGQFPGTYDFLSALYRLRALPLTEDARYSFTLRDNDVLYEAELKVTGRLLVKTNVGSFNTIVTQLRFPRNSSLNNYRIQIYFSDDERHVPVLFTGKHPSGEIRAELAGSELPGANPTSADPTAPPIADSATQVQPAPNPNLSPNTNVNPTSPNRTSPNTTTTTQPGGIPGIPANPNITNPPSPNTPPQAIPVNPNRTNAPLNTNPNAPPNSTSKTPPNSSANRPLVPAPNAAASGAASALPAGLPFNAGEQLNFTIYLENVQQPVGTASFQVHARSKYFGRDGLLLTGKAQTVGTAQTIFSANDEINTYVDPTTLLPFRFEMSLQESKRRTNQTVTIDQDRGKAATEGGAPMEVPVGTYDLLSVFYALRSFNLKSPKPNAVSLLVNNRPRTLFITFLKRETIELGGQQIPALQLSLTTDDAQGDRNALRLWVSEDQRRLPLRLMATTPNGKVRADLAILPITRQ